MDRKEFPPTHYTNLSVVSRGISKRMEGKRLLYWTKKGYEFDITRKMLETTMKELNAKGIGTVAKSAHPLTSKWENVL